MPNTRQQSAVTMAREAKGLSREGLADKAGVSLRTIERIELGEVTPHRATARVLAAALGLAPADLGFREST